MSKTLIDTQDLSTAYGSALYRGHRPARDAAVVALLRQMGALIVGKTATCAFGTWLPTSVRNPRAPGHTPGGSSAGSAAAVAAGLVPLALGTQTLGSILRPASYCGVIGFKPTYGRIPTAGVKPLAESLDTVGFLGESLDIVASAYSLVSRDFRRTTGSRAPRLGVVLQTPWATPEADAQETLSTAIDVLRRQGLAIADVVLPQAVADADPAAGEVYRHEMGHALLPDFMLAAGQFDQSLERAIARANSLSPRFYERALLTLDSARLAFAALMSNYDALICLAATGEAPPDTGTTGDPALNRIWTALHAPSLSLPVLHGTNGLPLGLQIVGSRFADVAVLKVARVIEAILKDDLSHVQYANSSSLEDTSNVLRPEDDLSN